MSSGKLSAKLGLACAGVFTVALLLATTSTEAAADAGYVGSRKCKKCHIKQYKSYLKTKMAKAYDILAPNASAKAKTKAGLSVSKDYRKDTKCLACHTVGFGKTGGFSLSMSMARAKKKGFLGVGCEGCHGPGKAYIGKGLMDKNYKASNTALRNKLKAAGYIDKPQEKNCKGCHNKKSPSYAPFNFKKSKKKGIHKHYKRKR